MQRVRNHSPSVLEPYFDLPGLDPGEDGAIFEELEAAEGARVGALRVEPLQGFDLLFRVPGILAIRAVFLLTDLGDRHASMEEERKQRKGKGRNGSSVCRDQRRKKERKWKELKGRKGALGFGRWRRRRRRRR
jgi:hypothetical protein